MKTRRILIYSPQFNAIGGIEVHVHEIAQLLAAQPATHVTVLTTSSSLAPSFVESLRASGVEYRYLDAALGRASRFRKMIWLGLQVWRLRRGYWDIVYTNAQGALAPLVWRVAKAGTRVIHHHHTSADSEERIGWGRYRNVLRSAPELVACSEVTRANLLEGVGTRDIRVLYCLCPPEERSAPSTERSPTEKGRLRFAYLGRLTESKGIRTIMRLAEDPALSDIEWHLHGAGSEFGANDFAGCARLFYHGPFSGPEALARIHHAVDALVLFSTHSEGLPIMLLEGVRSGLPWIASDRGGTRELALREPDCRVLSRDFRYNEARRAVREMADRIRAGATSRSDLARRYEVRFSPDRVRREWLRFLGFPEP
jgi:glycosyltransferase involved in cell wall biosynthesis